MPADASWRGSPKDWSIDLLHMGSTGLTTEAWRALTAGLLYGAAVWLSQGVGGSLWPSAWPWWAQLSLALLLGDFGAYWVHRGCHESSLLWRVHAMHHSSERLYVFASARNHPMNAILAYGSQLLPVSLLGAPVEVIALLSVFTGVHGMLQHANIDLRHGWLNWVFATADLHRWHHSTEFEESNTNFGSNIILWDIVFRTRSLPEGRPEAVGVADLDMPDNFITHLLSPFTLSRYQIEQRMHEVLGTPAPAPRREPHEVPANAK
jgi:sterol desaturase/sphingolipid hydroxylase (fatty acid hydroxylase superfamily)